MLVQEEEFLARQRDPKGQHMQKPGRYETHPAGLFFTARNPPFVLIFNAHNYVPVCRNSSHFAHSQIRCTYVATLAR